MHARWNTRVSPRPPLCGLYETAPAWPTAVWLALPGSGARPGPPGSWSGRYGRSGLGGLGGLGGWSGWSEDEPALGLGGLTSPLVLVCGGGAGGPVRSGGGAGTEVPIQASWHSGSQPGTVRQIQKAEHAESQAQNGVIFPIQKHHEGSEHTIFHGHNPPQGYTSTNNVTVGKSTALHSSVIIDRCQRYTRHFDACVPSSSA